MEEKKDDKKIDYSKFKENATDAGATAKHLKLGDLFKLSIRSFKVRPTRTLLTILGISVGIGTVFFLISLGYGLQYILIGRLAPTEDSLVSLETFYPGEAGLPITNQTLQDAATIPGVKEISPVSELTGDLKTGNVSGSVIVKAIDPSFFRLSGINPEIGTAFATNENSIVISNTALKLLGWDETIASVGKDLIVDVFPSEENSESASTTAATVAPKPKAPIDETESTIQVVVKGISVDDSQPPFIYLPVSLMKTKPTTYARFFARASGADMVEKVRDALVAKGFLISARIDLVNQATKITTAITIVLGVFGITALIVSAIGMFNTMLISFMERIFEVGIMKSIGATQQDIRNLFLMESLVMGLLGGIGGILLGVIGGEVFNFGLNTLARYLHGKPISLFIYPTQFMLFIVVLSGVVGVVSGMWPARKAEKLSAREAFLRK